MRAILTYHSIDDSASPLSVDLETFRLHAAWMTGGRVRVVPLVELIGLSDDDDAIALTFDDGLESFATHAWPVLRDHGLSATVFVVTDRVGGRNRWEPYGVYPEMPLLDWPALGRLAVDGVDIGSHTRTHESLLHLDDERLIEEIAGSAERIRTQLGVMPSAFAYPYGDYDARVTARAATCYRCACTTDLRAVRSADDVHALPRLDTFYLRHAGVLEAWGTRRLAIYLRARAIGRNLRLAARRPVR